MFHDASTAALDRRAGAARDGLPANALPVQVNEVTQVGLEAVAASFAYGAWRWLLLRAKPRHDVAGLMKTVALAEPISSASACRRTRRAIETTIRMRSVKLCAPSPRWMARASRDFRRRRKKRDVVRLALREMHAVAPSRSILSRCAGRAVRHARGQCRRLHALSFLRLGCRPARSSDDPNGRRCASPRTPACNAACVRLVRRNIV